MKQSVVSFCAIFVCAHVHIRIIFLVSYFVQSSSLFLSLPFHFASITFVPSSASLILLRASSVLHRPFSIWFVQSYHRLFVHLTIVFVRGISVIYYTCFSTKLILSYTIFLAIAVFHSFHSFFHAANLSPFQLVMGILHHPIHQIYMFRYVCYIAIHVCPLARLLYNTNMHITYYTYNSYRFIGKILGIQYWMNWKYIKGNFQKFVDCYSSLKSFAYWFEKIIRWSSVR